MNIICTGQFDRQIYTVAEIGISDVHLLAQYWETRTSIWTLKYPEIAGTDGLERDQFDHSSSFLVLIEGRTVVAGTRLIHAEDVGELPVGSCARVQLSGKAVEVSRFFFSPAVETEAMYAEQQFKLFIFGIVTYLKGQGYVRAYSVIRASLFKKLQGLDVPMISNGPTQRHGGKNFIPAILFETGQEFVPAQKQSIAPEQLAA